MIILGNFLYLSRYLDLIIYKGSAEEVVLDILLDADLLIFSRDSLLGGELIRTRGGEAFARKHLGFELDEKVTIPNSQTFTARNLKLLR